MESGRSDPELFDAGAQEEVERLGWALRLETGFALHVIVAETRDVLESALTRLPGDMVVLRPRPPRRLPAEKAASDILAEIDRGIETARGRPVLLDAMIAAEGSAWVDVFRQLNQLRNGLELRHPAPLIFAVSQEGESLLGREAPDLWSRRGSGMRLHDRRPPRAGSSFDSAGRDRAVDYPPPADWEAFESLCLDLFKDIWNDPGAQRHGRMGQPQAGVDIFGWAAGRRIGVQCKRKSEMPQRRVTARELEAVVEEALNFRPMLDSFIFATTGPRDAKVQQRAREITAEHRDRGLFAVEVLAWEDILSALEHRPELFQRLRRTYWPGMVPPGSASRSRLRDAVKPLSGKPTRAESLEIIRAVLKSSVEQDDWRRASLAAGKLGALRLISGDIDGAMRAAEQSVELADRSEDMVLRISSRSALAEALHQRGRRDEALRLFHEAEAIQGEVQPAYPLLYSSSGFRYCDLLLDEPLRAAAGETQDLRPSSGGIGREVEDRAARTLEWSEQNRAPILDIALDRLTLARAGFYRAVLEKQPLHDSRVEVDSAVDALRRSGDVTYLPLGLLTRAWLRHVLGDLDGSRSDLAEAREIGERGPMPLLLADVHLYRARLFYDSDALAEARRSIEKHGYGRRLGELADAEKITAPEVAPTSK